MRLFVILLFRFRRQVEDKSRKRGQSCPQAAAYRHNENADAKGIGYPMEPSLGVTHLEKHHGEHHGVRCCLVV